jgi:site-specific DNA-methyltransferase (adenine-specific)
LEKDFEDMKFDVVVGNPPYTDGSKANTPLYDKFIKKASELSSNVVAFVTPTSFAISDERGATETRKCLIKDKLKVVKFLGSEAFENANVDTLYYVADKSSTDTLVIDESNTPYHMTFVADEFIHKDKIVRDILIKCGTVNSKRSNFKFTRIDSLTTVKNQVPVLTLLTDVKEEKSVTNEIDDFFNDHKIVSTFLPNAKNHLSAMTYVAPGETVRKNYVVSVADSASIAKNTVNYLKSNLCCFIYDKTKTSRTLRSPQLKFIPKIDLSRSYTDDELYAHFNLSEEEIAYIEANVK